MAKAKKPKSEPEAAGEVSPTPAKKSGKAKAAPVAAAAQPMVDTGLAAQSAAKRLVAGLSTGPSTGVASPESASFKHLKESLNKPSTVGLGGLLDKTASPASKKSNLPFAANKQTGPNQTFGADVNRAGVPRRTGGG